MLRITACLTTLVALLTISFASTASAARKVPAHAAQAPSGGATFDTQAPQVTGAAATLLDNGLAAAPEAAPQEVKDMIAAANEIVGKPYVYGGGHDKLFGIKGRGYDCSGTVSYALNGAAGMLDMPLDSSSFMSWGERGEGTWVTVYTNPGHAFVVIAGLRLDTSAAGDPSGDKGPRWRPVLRTTKGFKARHPLGF